MNYINIAAAVLSLFPFYAIYLMDISGKVHRRGMVLSGIIHRIYQKQKQLTHASVVFM